MGGVGKTELAVQYAKTYENDYPGGICWLNVRDKNLAKQIIQFIQLQMGLEVPQKDPQGDLLTLKEQVTWCWTNWKPPSGLVLVILDDVTQLEDFSQLLPTNKRFRVVITTRLRDIDTNVEEIALNVLSPDEALELFTKTVGKTKVNKELETAKKICEWLGYLPLGIELVGRYIKQKPPHFKLAKMLEQLKQQRLHNQAIKNPQQKSLSTAQRGVLEAFELSWVELDSQTQQLAALIGLFVPEIFLWEWVESITKSLNWDESSVENGIEELYHRHLVQCLEQKDEYYYKTHPLIREFLQAKLNQSEHKGDYIQSFSAKFIEIGKTIPHTTTSEIINSVKNAIPHLTEVAENHLDAVRDENLCSVFLGLGRFYRGQGLYALAQPWYEQCVSEVKSRLGENHLDYAKSLNNLAGLYWNQGKYLEAKTLCIQELEITKQQLGENHLDYAKSLNNLALLYWDQGKYVEAEPLYIQALEIRKMQLGVNHPDTADSLECLASLYDKQGKYVEAEPLYIQALEIYKHQLGVNHPRTALGLNNLANFYSDQGKYVEAEPLYIQALEIYKHQLGVNHPCTARTLSNLGELYTEQGKYEEAELLLTQALEIKKQQLGENHFEIADTLNNLAILYHSQGKYVEAEPLYIQALKIYKHQLGENHPRTAFGLNNLGEFYTDQEKYNEAELLLTQALDIKKQQLGINHPRYADSLNALGLIYSYQGKHSEAENLLTQALAIAQRVLGSDHPDTVKYRGNLEKLHLYE
ncbi:NB-ARC domain-containing protein [Mastigocoleus testarum BC008]|uniref:NB-ARC domain-containing protein n=2 Tax=Mastigocoleus TaxID=996924 RepID=A0A0V7ZN29_9CYAN|nr:NB-ARC domain-containing protein [Mastigocoleus testarum BC008]